MTVRLRPTPRVVPLVLGLTLLAVGTLGVGTADAVPVGEREGESELLDTGRQLYVTGCASCHGADGEGVRVGGQTRGPSLEGAGEATAYYYLSTGRMPLSDSTDQPRRKEPAYDEEQIRALVAYLASIGDGAALPEVRVDETDLAAGGVIYRVNCQACHSAFGSGGALSYGRAAPHLHRSEPLEVAAAVRGGPGQMPVFNEQAIDDEALGDVLAYVEYLKDPVNEGGIQVGRNGPVPEGFVIWLFGVGGALLIVAWVGGRDPWRHRTPTEGGDPR